MHKGSAEIKDPGRIEAILCRGKYTTIALCHGDRPYVVTLSYGFDREGNALYFHSARNGLKQDIVEKNPRACATVIEDLGYQSGQCDHAYRSIVMEGAMAVVTDLAEKKHGMGVLLGHLENDPAPIKKRLLGSDAAYERFAVLKFAIHTVRGKEGK